MRKKTKTEKKTSSRKPPKKLDDLLRDLKEDELAKVSGAGLSLDNIALRDRQDTTH